jgi:hypothetical protein
MKTALECIVKEKEKNQSCPCVWYCGHSLNTRLYIVHVVHVRNIVMAGSLRKHHACIDICEFSLKCISLL